MVDSLCRDELFFKRPEYLGIMSFRHGRSLPEVCSFLALFAASTVAMHQDSRHPYGYFGGLY